MLEVHDATVSVFTTWMGEVGSPLVLPLLSVEGSGMVVGEWDSESMTKHFPLFFSRKSIYFKKIRNLDKNYNLVHQICLRKWQRLAGYRNFQ